MFRGLRDRRVLILALAASFWVAAQIAYWPLALSFGDEVGYVGQIKLMLAGHMRPLATSPGIWVQQGGDTVGQYPIFLALLATPFFALWPLLVFVPGILAALALAWVASRALEEHGHSPAWGLLVLAHPSVIIISRTVMGDLLLSAFAVGAWFAIHKGRRVTAATLLALTMIVKPIGFVVAGALIGGEALESCLRAGRIDRRTITAVAWQVGGALVGAAGAVALNRLATGRWWYSYQHNHIRTPWFWPVYFPRVAPVHAVSLLLLPPLLIVGAVPFWRRRDLGPLCVIGGLTTLMCFYFFVDRGRSFLDTLVLSPRLILPAVAFLLIGYLDLLAGLLTRLPGTARRIAPLLVLVPGVVCLVVAQRHQTWQKPQRAAVVEAVRTMEAEGARELGITWGAVKGGLLFRGPVSLVSSLNKPDVVLCGAGSASYREPGSVFSCDFEGYEDRPVGSEFHLLVRRPPRGGAALRSSALRDPPPIPGR